MAGTSTFLSGDGPVAELLCDSGAADAPFVRIYNRSSVDDSVITTDVDLDGAAYAVVGPAVQCVDEIDVVDSDNEILVLCDFTGGSTVPFLRRYSIDDGAVTTTDTDFDGTTPYVPSGFVTICDVAQIDYEPVILCDLGAGGTQFARSYRDGVLGVTTTDTLLDGTTPYVVVGPVAACTEVTGPGGGPVVVGDGGGSITVDGEVTIDDSDPVDVEVTNWRDDVELEVLCDEGNSDKSFLRRYEFSDDGTLDTIVDTELDGSTGYIPTGPVTNCAGDNDFEIVDLCDSIPQNELWAIQQDGANYDLIETNPLSGATTVLLNDFTTENVNCLAWEPKRRKLFGRTQSGGGANNVWEIDPIAPSAAVIGTVTGLPAGTWIFGAYDPNTDRWVIGGNSLPLYAVNLTTLVAEQASAFTLPAGGSGDIAFDECGRLYVSSDGVVTRYNTLLDGSPTTIATVPDNGSGFSGSGYWKDGFFIGAFDDGEVFIVNTSTGQVTTGLGPIAGGILFDFAADPRSTINVPFQRVWNLTAGTFTDTDSEGDPYTVEGFATIGPCPWCCDCGEPGDRPYGNPVATTFTAVGPGGSVLTALAARRVQALFEPQPTAVGSRDTINGVPLPDTLTDQLLTFGDLNAPGHVPPMTIANPGGSGRTILVIQEF